MVKNPEFAKKLISMDLAHVDIKKKYKEKTGETITTYTIKKLREELEDDSIEKQYEESKQKQQLRKEKAFLEKKDNKLMKELDSANKRLELLEVAQLDDGKYSIKSKGKSKKTESTAVICASDWHIEEVVKPEQVQWLNEYNLKVAEYRATNFFKNSLKLIQSFENETTIKDMVMWLGWDFISGYIHEELVEGNEVSPTEAILMVKRMLTAGIRYYLDNSDKNLTIVTSYWNHWRTTPKSRVSTWHANNFERLLYNVMADEFSWEKRVKFKISKWYFNELKVYNTNVRFHHWDWLKYNGGVGGLYIPTNKAIAQWNKWVQADIDVFWHRHQFIDGGNFICNGSLIGYWPYAMSIKASPERPQQALFLINEKFGKTIVAPIIVTE